MAAYVRVSHPQEAPPYDRIPSFTAKLEWPEGMRIPSEGESIEWGGDSFHVHVVHHYPQPDDGDQPHTYLVLRQHCRLDH